jgi:hypothetical protein
MTTFLGQPFLLSLCIGALLLVSTFVGYRLALITGINEDTHRHEHISGLREGLFVLLALLLGFMIAMVLPRSDQRRALVTEEANTIRAVWMQAQLLPEPQRGRTQQLLREYVGVRLHFGGTTLGDPSVLDRLVEQSRALQQQLWEQFLQIAQQNQTALAETYERGLIDIVGVSEKRLAAFEDRVPRAVWIIILVIAAFQAFIAGYTLKRKVWMSLVVTPLVIAVVVGLIADLDDPHTGLIRIEQSSMNRLANDMMQH